MRVSIGLLTRVLLVGLLACVVAQTWTVPARAAQTRCVAQIDLRNGGKAKLDHAAIMESENSVYVSRSLMARLGDEVREIYLDRVLSLQRGERIRNINGEDFIEFAYELQTGVKGFFWLKGSSRLAGRTPLGFTTLPLYHVESLKLKCPPPIDYNAPRREMH